MNIFESINAVVTTRQAAEHYGIECNRNGMARCPFHDDRTPSMKLDARFHCFGCGADGDVIDFTAKLLGISKYDAAKKLAVDFGITTNYHDPPAARITKVTPITEVRSERQWLLHAADVLIAYEKLLKDWRKRYTPPDQDSELHPLYVESLRQLDRIPLLVDMALCTDEAERHALYLNFKEEVQRIEDRKEISSLQERISEIDELYMKLYEDKAKDVITESRFVMMTDKLDAEQAEARELVQQHMAVLIEEDCKGHDIQLFVDELLRFASITELDEIVTHRLIDKIVIGEPYEENGETIQRVQIVYNLVGAISE